MQLNELVGQQIEHEGYQITPEAVEQFKKAIGAQFIAEMPPTFATLFRKTEYEWLVKLGIEVKNILHGDQEYQYLVPLVEDMDLDVRTTLIDLKERKTPNGKIKFVRVMTELINDERVFVIGRATFAVREPPDKTQGQEKQG